MDLSFIVADPLNVEADALILTADGDSERMIGNNAGRLAKRLGEELWEDVLADLDFPIAPGNARAAAIEDGAALVRWVILAAALDHLGRFDPKDLMRRALTDALSVAQTLDARRVVLPLPKGGWRLGAAQAARTLPMPPPPVDLIVTCRTDAERDEAVRAYFGGGA